MNSHQRLKNLLSTHRDDVSHLYYQRRQELIQGIKFTTQFRQVNLAEANERDKLASAVYYSQIRFNVFSSVQDILWLGVFLQAMAMSWQSRPPCFIYDDYLEVSINGDTWTDFQGGRQFPATPTTEICTYEVIFRLKPGANGPCREKLEHLLENPSQMALALQLVIKNYLDESFFVNKPPVGGGGGAGGPAVMSAAVGGSGSSSMVMVPGHGGSGYVDSKVKSLSRLEVEKLSHWYRVPLNSPREIKRWREQQTILTDFGCTTLGELVGLYFLLLDNPMWIFEIEEVGKQKIRQQVEKFCEKLSRA